MRIRSWMKMTTAMLVAVIVLGACGGGDESAPGESNETTTTAQSDVESDGAASTTTAADDFSDELGHVRYQIPGESFTFIPLLVAENLGYFADEGITVERTPNAGGGVAATQTVITGDADIAVVGSNNILAAITQNRPVRSIGNVAQASTIEVVVTSDTAERLATEGVTPDSPLDDRVAALEGLRFATYPEGTTTRMHLTLLLDLYGIAQSDVTITPLSDPPSIAAVAREGQVDALVDALPSTAVAVAEGWGVQWISFAAGEVPEIGENNYADLIAPQAFISENPKTTAAFLRGVQRAMDAVHDDPDAVKEALRESFPDMEQNVFDAAYAAIAPVFGDLQPSERGFANAVRMYNEGAEEPTDVSFDDFYDLSALNN